MSARKKLAKLLGRSYESRQETETKAAVKAEQTAAVASAVTTTKKAADGAFGDPSIKAQIYGKKSCP